MADDGGRCVPIPDFDIPELPLPLSLEPPALPDIDISADFCCRLALFIPLSISPLPGVVLSSPEAVAVMLALKAEMAIVRQYLLALPLKCPFQT